MSDYPTAPILDHMIWPQGTGPNLPTTSAMPIPLAAVGAAASLGSGIFNAISQNRANKRAYQQQLDFWRMNNEYNHPSAQMARLREAGLNPNLIYGSGVKGATGASSAASSPPVSPLQIENNPITEYQRIKSTELQTDNLREQNTLLRQEGLLKTLDAMQKNQNIKRTKSFNKYYESQLEAQLIDLQNRASISTVKSELSNKELDLIRQYPASYDRYLLQAWDLRDAQLNNAQKLARLRELEAEIKEDMKDFTASNQFINILAKIANIIK